ncbi:hypothetical protein HPB49_025587 [Dermacentor silvarum]|uniref:Uncharacterized protein n=1 Tax=Dermacentor silvarum TaxID=543639 RepID=A0ACB8CNI2_DERSI|nr:hypothetical protein HPB49_025587 [Dermacentor silvarum]
MDPNRGLVKKKKAVFQQRVRTTQPKPDVILLQEMAGSQASLQGYRDVPPSAPMDRGVTTLVRKGLVAVRHDIRGVNLDHLLIEIIPQRHRKDRMFIPI